MSNPKPDIKLHPSWLLHLEAEFSQDYMIRLKEFLLDQQAQGKTIFPKGAEYFNALNTTPLDQVRVVILGQDPYHGPGQAHGLCFSVRDGVRYPPSLINIFKEIQADLSLPADRFPTGNLTSWAKQGVLLLNSVLTVEQGQAASHQGKGWETFTDRVIEVLSVQREKCVFMLWGSYAQKKGAVIDRNKHRVLLAPHPSPLSAHRGFFGCRHFSQCNQYLLSQGFAPIDWSTSQV
ncbi:MAG: uracil-DNA glycosylase [Pseudomonadales bacterium]|nr:uracil-DNA glycosylase [Pseudomonadales bacterium]